MTLDLFGMERGSRLDTSSRSLNPTIRLPTKRDLYVWWSQNLNKKVQDKLFGMSPSQFLYQVISSHQKTDSLDIKPSHVWLKFLITLSLEKKSTNLY